MAKRGNKDKRRPWRKYVKQQMKRAAKREAVLRYRSEYPVFNYRWEHVLQVVRLAKALASQVGADVEVAEAAAWLHDVAKSRPGIHSVEGAKMARKILKKTNFPSKKIALVCHAIEVHMGLWRNEPLADLNAAVLWDADKLSKLGSTAVFHWLGAEYAKGQMMTMDSIITFGREEDWQERTLASFHTEPARAVAQQRLARYRLLWNNLERESRALDVWAWAPVSEADLEIAENETTSDK